MGLRADGKATVWSIEDKGNYSVCSLSTSKKNKDGNYETDWSNKFCHFVGDAHKAISAYTLGEGEYIRLKIKSFEVTNNYDKVKKIQYTNYSIFDIEFEGGENAGGDEFSSVDSSLDAELPFV